MSFNHRVAHCELSLKNDIATLIIHRGFIHRINADMASV